ncbi:glycerol-3-phosphate dehydrogenase [Marinobacter halodurans]|uniref:Glycerol-3-phosphate dehydrogenase n=1 Tax=Marinobacter halodurans TaxID=2528979 RepID=A0ABY1ZIJ3_9GAMM|nr:glycerol-3-phosphate dehydrogenase [Marinobacter halodurans]TBW54373.1 glycerol-3-phosphate dehydrogenase [Marinobacter halodurans]
MSAAETDYDLVVVGGGVNGTGIAMDAAGRGLKTLLCEMNDLASATSSSSSKLIHGGLRYLEHYEFKLVRQALAEREALLRNAPHIMWPMRFRLPYQSHLRPAWMIRTGLFLYDHLAKRELLKGSNSIRFNGNSPLIPEITRGFEYSDGWVDDARLVVLTAKAAEEKGARVMTRTRCERAERAGDHWVVTLNDRLTGKTETVTCKTMVNATGPWVSALFRDSLHIPAPKQIRMVKGSHIVVPRIHDEPEAYILQNADERIIFVIPYEDDFSLVGTTDVDYEGDPKKAVISDEEVDYLIGIVNDYFRNKLTPDDVVWSYSGVRPLMDDEGGSAQKASRDYTFEVDAGDGKAPLISIFGGKITTYRKLAEAATDRLCDFFPEAGPNWTRSAPLPGGDFTSQEDLLNEFKTAYPWLPTGLARRYVRTYGTCTRTLLEGCQSMEGMGHHFGANLYAREIDYLTRHEWAVDAEDIAWRRTKLGLRLTAAELSAIQDHLANQPVRGPSASTA